MNDDTSGIQGIEKSWRKADDYRPGLHKPS